MVTLKPLIPRLIECNESLIVILCSCIKKYYIVLQISSRTTNGREERIQKDSRRLNLGCIPFSQTFFGFGQSRLFGFSC